MSVAVPGAGECGGQLRGPPGLSVLMPLRPSPATVAGRGEDAFLRACGPGQVLGEELLLPRAERQGGRGIAAVALTGCTTLAVSREAFLACLRDRPHLWEGLAGTRSGG